MPCRPAPPPQFLVGGPPTFTAAPSPAWPGYASLFMLPETFQDVIQCLIKNSQDGYPQLTMANHILLKYQAMCSARVLKSSCAL